MGLSLLTRYTLFKEATNKLCDLANETVELIDESNDELGEDEKKEL